MSEPVPVIVSQAELRDIFMERAILCNQNPGTGLDAVLIFRSMFGGSADCAEDAGDVNIERVTRHQVLETFKTLGKALTKDEIFLYLQQHFPNQDEKLHTVIDRTLSFGLISGMLIERNGKYNYRIPYETEYVDYIPNLRMIKKKVFGQEEMTIQTSCPPPSNLPSIPYGTLFAWRRLRNHAEGIEAPDNPIALQLRNEYRRWPTYADVVSTMSASAQYPAVPIAVINQPQNETYTNAIDESTDQNQWTTLPVRRQNVRRRL